MKEDKIKVSIEHPEAKMEFILKGSRKTMMKLVEVFDKACKEIQEDNKVKEEY